MKQRGYSTKRYSTLKTAYHNKPTALQKASYDLHLIGIIKASESEDLNEILKAGISPNPCNTYGESLVHMVCRRGDYKLLQVFIQNGCDIQVADDYGRTPLHDACWAAEPAFDTVTMLLEQDSTLLQMTDCRGFLPLSYVRKDHWPAWVQYFDTKKDLYFPNLLSTVLEQSMHSTVSTVCEFVDQSPDTRPLQDPTHALPLDLANMVASGAIKPEEAMYLRNQRMAKHESEGDDDSDDDDSDDDDDSEYDSDDDDNSDYDTDDEIFDNEEFKNLLGNLTLRLESPRPSMAHGTVEKQ
jgi:ankyrin repeat protein